MNTALCGASERVEAMARRWSALHADAAMVGQLADLAPEFKGQTPTAFSEALAKASDWQCRLAMEAIEDIDAMLQPGLTALRTIFSRGQDAAAPALALWREFYAAREAVLAMLSVEANAQAH